MADDPESMLKIRMSSEARQRAAAEKRRQQWGGEKGAKKLGAHLRGITLLPVDEEAALIHGTEGQNHGLPLYAQLAEDRLREIREGKGLESFEQRRERQPWLATHWMYVLANVAETDDYFFLRAVASSENQDAGDPLGDSLDRAIERLERVRTALGPRKPDQSSN